MNLDFLTETADEHKLEHFINANGDFEIAGKNLAFHLADLESGEPDAIDRWNAYDVEGKRCVFVYPPYLKNPNRVNVYKNILLYNCGIFERIYARNTVCKTYSAIRLKSFFEENNIEGYRNATKVYVLEDKDTHKPYMAYSVGHAYFGKGAYDMEIARGACKLGYQVVGGASKLWKNILDDNPTVNSIVYYVDRREYDGRSISHLMDGYGLGKIYNLKGSASFMNYWTRDVIGENGKSWHKAGDYANREPHRNQEVKKAYENGDCIAVKNPGSYTNVFVRNGFELDGNNKVVKCS